MDDLVVIYWCYIDNAWNRFWDSVLKKRVSARTCILNAESGLIGDKTKVKFGICIDEKKSHELTSKEQEAKNSALKQLRIDLRSCKEKPGSVLRRYFAFRKIIKNKNI